MGVQDSLAGNGRKRTSNSIPALGCGRRSRLVASHDMITGRSPKTRAFFLILLLTAAAGFGQSTIWNSPGTGNFLTAGNWTNGVPSSTTDTSITNGTTG